MTVEYCKYIISISGIGRDDAHERLHKVVLKKYHPDYSENYKDNVYSIEILGTLEPEPFLSDLKSVIVAYNKNVDVNITCRSRYIEERYIWDKVSE